MQCAFYLAGAEGFEFASQPRLRYPTTRRVRASLVDRGTSLRSLHLPPAALATSPGTRFWRQCHIKRTVQIVPTVEPFVALGLLNLMPFDALLMLSKNLPCKADAQLPKNDALNFILV